MPDSDAIRARPAARSAAATPVRGAAVDLRDSTSLRPPIGCHGSRRSVAGGIGRAAAEAAPDRNASRIACR